MRGDRGSRKGETGGGSGRAGWLNGEKDIDALRYLKKLKNLKT